MARPSLRATFASKVFQKLLAESKDRLAKAQQLRSALQAQLEAGQTPTGYRADFLDEASHIIVEQLCVVAQSFNDAHPDDMCTTADLLDILATARNKLLKGVEETNALMATEPKGEPN